MRQSHFQSYSLRSIKQSKENKNKTRINMHYRSYFFLALICIFQPITSERSVVDGRQREHSGRVLSRSAFPERRFYVREDHRNAKPATHTVLIQREQRIISARNRERAYDRYLQADVITTQHQRSNDFRATLRRSISQNAPERHGPLKADRNVVLKYAERSLTVNEFRQEDRRTQKARQRIEIYPQNKGIGRMSRNERYVSRQRDNLKQISLVRQQHHDVKIENMQSKDMRYERRVGGERRLYNPSDRIRQSANVRNTESVIGNRNKIIMTRETHQRSTRDPLRKVRDARNYSESRKLERYDSQRRGAIVRGQREVLRESRQVQKFDTMERFSRSRSEVRPSPERNSIIVKDEHKNAPESRRVHSALRNTLSQDRESRYTDSRSRRMERDVTARREWDNFNYITRSVDMRDEITEGRNSRSSRDVRDSDTERMSRLNTERKSPTGVSRNSIRLSVRQERRNTRENMEYNFRNDVSRHMIVSHKNEAPYLLAKWQVLIYTLQGMYLCSVLFKALAKTESGKKQRYFGWLPTRLATKVE